MTKLKVAPKFLLLAFGLVCITAFPADEKLEEPLPVADSNRGAADRGRAWSAWSSASHTNRGRFNGKSGNVDDLHSNGTVSQNEPPMTNATEVSSTEAPGVVAKEPVTVQLPGEGGAANQTTVAPPAPSCGANQQQIPPPVPALPIGPGPNIGNGYPPLESIVQQVAGNQGKNNGSQPQVIVVLVPMRDQQPVAPAPAPAGAGDDLRMVAPRSSGEELDQGAMMW